MGNGSAKLEIEVVMGSRAGSRWLRLSRPRPASYDGAVVAPAARRATSSTGHRATARCAVIILPSPGWAAHPAAPNWLGCSRPCEFCALERQGHRDAPRFPHLARQSSRGGEAPRRLLSRLLGCGLPTCWRSWGSARRPSRSPALDPRADPLRGRFRGAQSGRGERADQPALNRRFWPKVIKSGRPRPSQP